MKKMFFRREKNAGIARRECVKVCKRTPADVISSGEESSALVGAGRGKIGRRCYKSPRFHPARALYMSGMHLTAVAYTYARFPLTC